MELTSNPDILRIASDRSAFYVNGLRMEFVYFPDNRNGARQAYLWAWTPEGHETFEEYAQESVYVRQTDGHQFAAYELEELIERLKTGNFKVW